MLFAADNLGELGISGGPPGAGGAPAWAPGGQPGAGGEFQNKTIWSDPHMGGAPEHSMHHAHMQYPRKWRAKKEEREGTVDDHELIDDYCRGRYDEWNDGPECSARCRMGNERRATHVE